MRRTASLVPPLRVFLAHGTSRALFAASAAIALAACSAAAPDGAHPGDPRDDGPSATEEGRATSGAPAANADDAPAPTAIPGATTDRFCPSGFAYDAAHRLCTSATEAAGPFPPAMVDACTKSGGGAPCAGDRWAKALAIGLRGSAACPAGTTMNASIGYCTEGDDAYGPFSKSEVAACKAKSGGASCESMRWSVTFFGGTAGGASGGAGANPLNVPYYSQYQDAKSAPGSSCGNTSAAMVLSYFGKKITPDGVRSAFSGGGQCGGGYQPWQCADGLASIYRSEGLVGHAKNGGSRGDIKRMIDEGRPVIIHTNMTSAGHIVVIVGYDDAAKQWVVNDPAGHWCGDGYDSCGGRGLTAKQIRYSYASFGTDVIGADGDVYISAADTKEFTL